MMRHEVEAPRLQTGRYLVPEVLMPDGSVRGLSVVDIVADDDGVFATSISPFDEEVPNTIQIDTPLLLYAGPARMPGEDARL